MASSITGDIMDNVPIIDHVIMNDPVKATVEHDFYKNVGNDALKSEEGNQNEGNQEEERPSEAKQNDPPLSAESADDDRKLRFDTRSDFMTQDPKIIEQQKLISSSKPSNPLESALYDEIHRKEVQIERLTNEVLKLKQFVSKRKQTYKRKRKEDGAPTRALSAYNIFIQDRFSRLAEENEKALKSSDTDAKMKRVPPSSLVASTGNQWKELPAEQKAYYEERAKADRKRYEEQMAKYQPPDKQANRKRNKTGYNMFFSYHVNHLKNTDAGVPSERGSVARLVGNAWKELSNEKKLEFEQMADKQNGMNSDGEDDNETVDEDKRRAVEYPPGPPIVAIDPNAHRQIMPPQMGHAPVVHQPAHHDPRMYPPPPGPHGPYQPYPPPPPGYYDYPPPPPPYPHAPPPQHPPPQHGSGQRGSNQERVGQHQVPAPHQGHPYPGPPPPHHHHYHPPPPPHHYSPPHMEQR